MYHVISCYIHHKPKLIKLIKLYVNISRFRDRGPHQGASRTQRWVGWEGEIRVVDASLRAKCCRHVEVNCVVFFFNGASFWDNAWVLTFDPAHHNSHNIIIYHTFWPSSTFNEECLKTTKPAWVFARESRCWASWYAFRNEPRSRTPWNTPSWNAPGMWWCWVGYGFV